MQGALYVSEDCGGSGSGGSIVYMGVGLVSAKHNRINVVERRKRGFACRVERVSDGGW